MTHLLKLNSTKSSIFNIWFSDDKISLASKTGEQAGNLETLHLLKNKYSDLCLLNILMNFHQGKRLPNKFDLF